MSESSYEKFLKLTRPLLFLFELLVQFLVFRLFVEVVVAVLGEFPLVCLVHQIRSAACEVHAELLNVDLHDATVNRHSNLKPKQKKQPWVIEMADEDKET